ncbi:Helicase associated domain protein [Nocardia sp. NPDC057272]|uniref:DEAD/DEAH box helicase n=1 Tax=Nocardia sp. NPDC057272 TaxID=3346079 RepID=UPI003635F75A
MSSLTELLDQLDPNSSAHRGTQFERICQWFLTHDPAYAHEIQQVWLWDDWPDKWGSDAGIDLVAKDRQGKLWAIQAKAYATTTSITKHDIDTFISESARSIFSFRLLITTTNKIGSTAKRTLEAQEKQSAVLLRGDLEASQVDWPTSPSHLHGRPLVRKQPRPHQRSAIDAVLKGFQSGSALGQLIMACGTGKTLTGLFINDELGAERTLVLVPSLALLAQTLREWTANSSTGFEFLPVCSDPTVVDRDSTAATTSDLGFPVTTSPAEIAEFLSGSGRRVVFATYQSSAQISTAFDLEGVPAFDLVIADEAHRCAGRTSSEFGAILNAGFIETRRRLFMTATPRFFTGSVVKEATEADFEIASMDDHSAFGPVFHRLGFAEAIANEMLTDYRVVIVGVDDATYRDWAEQGRLVTTNGNEVTDARTLAGQIGLAKAMHRYDLRRTISFHSRVSRAREFAAELPTVVDWMPSDQRPQGRLWAEHASGTMSTGKRHALLQHVASLHDCDRALLANARCLTEGIDVPALDGVAFIDPRRSEVDIVQAVGRAIRLATDKTIGTIVIPVFVDTGLSPETALNDSSFKPVWDVIQALRSHDDTLGETLDQLRHKLGRSGNSAVRLPGKIVLDLPATVGHDFVDAFDVRLVEQTTATWEFWVGLLERFIDQEGHALVPANHKIDGFAIGSWVAGQRHKHARGRLDSARKQQLDAVPGWVWDALTAQWEEGFARLVAYVDGHGHARVPQSFRVDGYRLGSWVTIQRASHAEGRSQPDREARLETLPEWSWDPRSDRWEASFRHMVTYVDEHGHARVPKDYTLDGCRLGGWAQIQRSRYATSALAPARIERLQALPGWSWSPDADQWDKFFGLLVAYVEEHGNARVPQAYTVDGHRLGSWLSNQRHQLAKGTLAAGRAERLQALSGWTVVDPWEEWFAMLVAYAEKHGHTRVPKNHSEQDLRLGNWVAKQRDKYAAAALSADKIERLEGMPGWAWDPHADQWEQNFLVLEAYSQENGHARVPKSFVIDGHRLGQWVGIQRASFSKRTLARDRVQRLQALPLWSWDPIADQWETSFARLTAYVQEHGHARVLKSYADQSGSNLGSWVGTQRSRYAKGAMDAEQQRRLEALPGWCWNQLDVQWEAGHAQLAAFVEHHGHARVPVSYVDPTGHRLGQWCKVQRRAKTNGGLDADRQQRLEALRGWSWDLVADQWEAGFAQLITFVEENGHARVPDAFKSVDSFRLGQWVGVQRRAQTTGTLTAARQFRLTALPDWTWNPVGDQWESGFARLAGFVEQHGHARVPADWSVGTFRLGQWVLTQRSRYAKGRIADHQVKRLEDLLGWSWDTLNDQWETGLAHLTDFAAQYGHALVPQNHVDETGFHLGSWVATQRSRYAKSALDPERATKIEQAAPDWSWQPHTDRWEQEFTRLLAYVEKNGHARVPRDYEVDGHRLGEWCKRQRDSQSSGNLTSDRLERLNALECWSWDPNADSWEEGFVRLLTFVEQHGHALVPRDLVVDGYRLGYWASNQRAARSRGTLSSDRVSRIEKAVPQWSWMALDDRWGASLTSLLTYTAEHGHARVPQSYIDQTGFRLGTWVATQRARFSKGALTTDRAERLEAVTGWAWDPHAHQWETSFVRLLAYVEQHGHALVPQKYVDQTGFRLGGWVLTQRRRKIKRAISDDQAERLEALPEWTWDAGR